MLVTNHFRIFIFVAPILAYDDFNDNVKSHLDSCGRETRHFAVQNG